MVKRLATSPHDPLGITDSACKNQSVMVSVQYGPFNTNIPIRSTTIGKSRVARDPITMHTSWRSNSDIACVTSIGYPRTWASGESSTTKHRLLHASRPHPTPAPDHPTESVARSWSSQGRTCGHMQRASHSRLAWLVRVVQAMVRSRAVTGPGVGPADGAPAKSGRSREDEREKPRVFLGAALGFCMGLAGSVGPDGSVQLDRIKHAGPLGSLGLNGAGDSTDDFTPNGVNRAYWSDRGRKDMRDDFQRKRQLQQPARGQYSQQPAKRPFQGPPKGPTTHGP
ncbi:starch synthase 3, chloroplastic/amyloplastic [Dorcoceras hygrometricum]|uniref:Starch synthase 3, chloroplastic/amyloplastic n=1 Tax=Dorcoceras hygrometricum TaxID=472368 RepID=A0A2Z7B8X7_9LAMI|nr:starch synthase 3, chloroplastic/amyloplastic [Dorcoceras hygrometricum]